MRFKSSYLIAAALAVGSTLWIASGVVTGNEPSPVEAGQAAAPKVSVPVVRVASLEARLKAKTVVLFGRTEAIKQVDIAAETVGKIVTRAVKKGAWVKKGTVILRLAMDDREMRLAEAKAKLEYQEIAYNAAKQLSQQQFQSKVKLAEEWADLARARAELEAIELDIRRTKVRAPMDGFVDSLPLSIGEYIGVGDTVAGIVNLHPIRIVGQVSERNVTQIHLGGPATARLANGHEIKGVVRYISKIGSESTRTFRVDVWADNPEGSIPEGLTAEVRLPAGEELAHLVSPAVLTLDDAGAIGVKVVDGEDRVRFYPVSIVADMSEGIWLAGLPTKIRLITVGQEYVRDGQLVRVAPDQPAGVSQSTDASADPSPS